MSDLSTQGRRAIGLALLVSGALWLAPADVGGKPRSSAVTAAPARTKPSWPDGAVRTAARSGAAGCVHVVGRGDSLAGIAAKYRVPRRSIVTANHLANADRLSVGRHLRITPCKAQPARRVVERATDVISIDGATLVVARVGPRRIPTSLFMSVPELHEGPAFQWPIDGLILSGFGHRPGGWHAGVDIKGEIGAPIRAAAAGVVVLSTWEATYGYVIKIHHQASFETIYAHNLNNLVEVGDRVQAGALIATVGRSGRASAFHLHFEVRKGGIAYNPLHLLERGDAPVLASAPDPVEYDDAARE